MLPVRHTQCIQVAKRVVVLLAPHSLPCSSSTLSFTEVLSSSRLFVRHLLVAKQTISVHLWACKIWLVINYHVQVSPTRNLRCCGAQLLCNFRVRKFCHRAQLSRNFGRFRAVLALIIFHFEEIWRQIGPLSARHLSFRKFVAVCSKIATCCLHAFFDSRCLWAVTLQRILQYSLSLSCTKTFFPKISNFCTSLGIYNIDRRCFVVRCQNLPKYHRTKVTFYIKKWAKLRATLAQLFLIFCATSATSLAQLLDFLSATFWGD